MKRFSALLILAFVVFAAHAQTEQTEQQSDQQQESEKAYIDDDIYTKGNITEKKPLAYPKLREADVMWSKKLWQRIDCRKKMNQPLYFPTTEMEDRKSLIQVIMEGFDNPEYNITAYKTDLLEEIMTKEEVMRGLGAGTETIETQQPDGTIEKQTITQDVRYQEIKQYEIREEWYFDRKYSRLRVRIVAIAPIREWINPDTGEKRRSQPFWLFYPEIRELLASYEVFNRHNDAQRVSYEDFFQQRRFQSFVTRESNVYGNRFITEYTTGVQTLLEAERIRNEVFKFEHDLWEY